MNKLFYGMAKISVSDVENIADTRRVEREIKRIGLELQNKFATKSKLFAFLQKNSLDSFPREVKITEDRRGKPIFGYLSLRITTDYGFHAETQLLKDQAEAKMETDKAKALIASWPRATHAPSKSFSLAPIIGALKKDGQNHGWVGASHEAKDIFAFVERFWEKTAGMSNEEMKAILSGNVAEVNDFLANHGFDLRIEQLIAGSTFMAAVMQIIVKWIKKGEPKTIKAKDGNEYSGVTMTDQTLFTVMTGAPQGILVLNTQSKDKVCITVHPEAPESGMESWKLCFDLMNKTNKAPMPAEDWEVKFPMIDFKAEEEIPLAGSTKQGNPPQVILQAKMQNIFQMDEAGAIAKSAFVAEMIPASIGWTSKRARLVIDEPCLVWIEREGVPFPVFAGWFNYGQWNDPKDKTL